MGEVNGDIDNEKSIIRERLCHANTALKVIADDNKDTEIKDEIIKHIKDYFGFVSTYGVTVFKWEIVKPSVLYMIELLYEDVLRRNLAHITDETEKALLENDEKVKELKDYIIEKIKSFEEAPFTIQRLSEIIYNSEMYGFIFPLLNAITKIVSVITTQTPLGIRITGVNEDEVVDENIILPTPNLHLKVDELDDDIVITKRPNTGGIENCFISSETVTTKVEEVNNVDSPEKK